MRLHHRDDFISRITYEISQSNEITLIVGSPISYDYANRKGVGDVNEVIQEISKSISSDKQSHDRLQKILAEPESNTYQKAFEYVLSIRGAKFANGIIKKIVQQAQEPQADAAQPMEWHLAPAVNAIGRILSKRPDIFGSKIITTNFDPLIEQSIKKHGGSVYTSHYHRDGNPSTTSAEGTNVIHLHGHWENSDTLHISSQLLQHRPQLKSYLQDLFKRTIVVVVAYGGWDDLISQAIEDVVQDDNAEPEILWAFKNSDLSHLEISEPRLLNRLRPGISRGRVQLYGGVDCHDFFPLLAESICPNDLAGESKPASQLLTIEEKTLADFVGRKTERRSDTAPRIDGFVGRDIELNSLRQADAVVFAITGFGGQGKSTLAAKFMDEAGENILKDWRDCREEGNTAQTAIALFLELISSGSLSFEEVIKCDHKTLIDLVVEHSNAKPAILVLDNIDTYVDMDMQRPTGIIGELCDRLLEVKTKVTIILTCRPRIDIAHSQFFALPLSGLTEQSTTELFKNKSAGYSLSPDEKTNLMRLTEGHPLYVSMLAAQRLSTNKDLSQILREVESSRSEAPAKILRSTYQLLTPEQMEILRTLAELERPEDESALEEVTGKRYNKLVKALKRLRDLSLIMERQDFSGKTLVDLHPLVRQFLRKEYPKKDRESFVGRIILYFDRQISLVVREKNAPIPRNVLDVWIHKIEVLCNHHNWSDAILETMKIEYELERAGLTEDVARIGLRVFQGVNWLEAIEQTKEFRRFINKVCQSLSYTGDHCSVDKWLQHYSDSVGSRAADKQNIFETQAFDAWLRHDYATATQFAQSAVDISKQVDVDLPDPTHTLALALRDSGETAEALQYLLEGLSLSEALSSTAGKSAEFFGNIGRCLQLDGQFTEALAFYKRCGKEMEKNPRSTHNAGWLRMWVGESLIEIGRIREGFEFVCLAKSIWEKDSRLLARRADESIERLRETHGELDFNQVNTWRAEQMFNSWVSK